MKFSVACVGKMKAGAEKELCDRYLDRARKAGKSLGITAVNVIELPESKAGRTADRKAEEAGALLKAIPSGAVIIALDEHGKALTSEAFSDKVRGWTDSGVSDVVLVIGGADGHGPELLSRADLKLALGTMTWPHQIVRILCAEQIYRAITIMSGHPYHRV
ncbi:MULTISPECIES: 23S rRNA (pseudouridine(1915)-N(3))-methyltransferase RlmH [Pseudovibrio]|uniref:23S rRNA (pseudouridine(1915)-N(3))-methyltransferase RlmH n=1 Tax=Stappiaceae TaxID=2821832 RepID=UPI0023666C5C|nr:MULTISPECIES: 23S rRNA (pseudouridine(1915)-N(3))-methyltransferase RlmH [Pseudovibrio]MDD7909822.1 23S rRNA (pseudouridine(1915)-N(3))-methyltransferase RlmH [Pseudovibrio exalbescens]MDX5592162.1 23S rRNA (pseudouridine(1915)-N(3))-methyltransferase RlmH [Pseudovibrio sp. SPO723]